MTTITDIGDFERDATYKVTETFEGKLLYKIGNPGGVRLYFELPSGEKVWIDSNTFRSATEVQVTHPLWPPLAGEVWESPDGERKFARLDGQRIYLCGSLFGDSDPVEITPSLGWKPVLTERS